MNNFHLLEDDVIHNFDWVTILIRSNEHNTEQLLLTILESSDNNYTE